MPIIVDNTLIKKRFNLWIKTFKYNIKIKRIYSIVAKKQRFNLMRYIFIGFKNYIKNYK